MRLYEHEAKQVFARAGLAIPERIGLIRDPAGLEQLDPPYPVMLKAQALLGGRGKAGGVRQVGSAAEARAGAAEILDLSIGGYPVPCALLEAVAQDVSGACYLGVTSNPVTANTVIIASAAGGVDIEEVARTKPDAILRRELPENPETLSADVAAEVAAFLVQGLGGDGELQTQLATATQQLHDLYQEHDCKVAEINPLLITPAGPLAVDAKLVIDDNALYRQVDLLASLGIEGKRHDVAEPTAREQRAARGGFPYVDLLPEGAAREPDRVYVGLVPGGAGYGIFSIDEVTTIGERHFGGRVVPVNFMDSGGGPSLDAVAEMFNILMDHPLVDLIISSRFGGISSCDIYIRGLVQCLRDRHAAGQRLVPVYGRMVGTDLAKGRDFLEAELPRTPEALAGLSMVVGNRRTMAEVIREALADFLERRAGA